MTARQAFPIQPPAAEPSSAAEVDELLRAGAIKGALHEVYAASLADLPASAGFTTALALRAAEGRPVVWVRHDALGRAAGRPHPAGLLELGLHPRGVVLVRAGNVLDVLRAAGEAARCPALGAVVVEVWGESPKLDLTASRRLALAAQASGTAVLVLRAAAEPAPSAATTRWSVRSLPSRALPAAAPGRPAFAVTLLRHRGGVAPREWRLEWDRDRACFLPWSASTAPVSRPVAAVPSDRPGAARVERLRLTG